MVRSLTGKYDRFMTSMEPMKYFEISLHDILAARNFRGARLDRRGHAAVIFPY
jgi:hypothetical protein